MSFTDYTWRSHTRHVVHAALLFIRKNLIRLIQLLELLLGCLLLIRIFVGMKLYGFLQILVSQNKHFSEPHGPFTPGVSKKTWKEALLDTEVLYIPVLNPSYR